jgi:hypothetical protein
LPTDIFILDLNQVILFYVSKIDSIPFQAVNQLTLHTGSNCSFEEGNELAHILIRKIVFITSL